jgi:hypothetical protein
MSKPHSGFRVGNYCQRADIPCLFSQPPIPFRIRLQRLDLGAEAVDFSSHIAHRLRVLFLSDVIEHHRCGLDC